MSNEQELIEIRCPHKRYFSDYKDIRVCGNKCAEVYKGSKGRAFCWRCRKQGQDPYFYYDVPENYLKPPIPKVVVEAKSTRKV